MSNSQNENDIQRVLAGFAPVWKRVTGEAPPPAPPPDRREAGPVPPPPPPKPQKKKGRPCRKCCRCGRRF